MKEKILRKKKQISVSSNEVVRKNKLAGGILVIGIVLLFVLVLLILLNAGFFESSGPEQLFQIKDECSFVMGNIIHNMRDSGDCHVKCLNECEIRALEFVRTNFSAKDNSCHSCDCYCR